MSNGGQTMKVVDHGRVGVTYSWRWRLRRLVVLAAAVALAVTAIVIGTVGDAQANHGGSGWSDTTHNPRWGHEFRLWNTARPLLRREVANLVGSDWAVRRNATGAGIDVALVDTGIAPVWGLDDPDLVVNGPDLSLDFQAGMASGLDAYGHGTHMASLIAGRGGMAEDARLVNLKVGSADGAVDVSQMIAAIDWAVQHRNDPGMNIRVLSLSGGTDSTQPYLVDPLAHAVESAWHHGIVVVAAAGNSGGALADPAVDPYVLSVGAADMGVPNQQNDDAVASFSSVGTPVRGVDLVAPGVSLLGLRVPGSAVDLANPQAVVAGLLFKGSGTSQAAAVVAGGVAQLLSARPDLTPDQVKALLVSTARDLARSPLAAQGGGLLDLKAALSAPAPNAVQSFPVSNGLGTLEGARGTDHLVAENGNVLQGEFDLQGGAWKPATWALLSAAGSAWTGGTWNGNIWSGADWAPVGAGAAPFTGHTWRSEVWTGHTWRSDVWLESSWQGHTWRNGAWG